VTNKQTNNSKINLPKSGLQIILPAKEAIMQEIQAENGLDQAKFRPASFRTAKTHKIMWQISNQGAKSFGNVFNWSANILIWVESIP
jgi:hypothetical protein